MSFNTFTPQIKGSSNATELQLAKILIPFQQELAINSNRTSCQQHWNVSCNCIVFTMYFKWYFCNHVVLIKLCILNSVLSKPNGDPCIHHYLSCGVWSGIGWWSYVSSSTTPFSTAPTKLNWTSLNLAINNRPMWIAYHVVPYLQYC